MCTNISCGKKRLRHWLARSTMNKHVFVQKRYAMCMCLYIYIYIYMFTYLYIYIYKYRERER